MTDPVRSAERYQDRTAERRQTVGSDMPELSYPNPPPVVYRALSEESIGHMMLKKLGRKKGEGLGKNSKGIIEPVKADVREARTGLGSMARGKHSLDIAGSKSAAKHRRLAKHYLDMVAKTHCEILTNYCGPSGKNDTSEWAPRRTHVKHRDVISRCRLAT